MKQNGAADVAPLNVLPKNESFAFSAHETAVIDRVELLCRRRDAGDDDLGAKDFAELLPLLAGHARITLGKAATIAVSTTPWSPSLRATLETNGEIVLRLASRPRHR